MIGIGQGAGCLERQHLWSFCGWLRDGVDQPVDLAQNAAALSLRPGVKVEIFEDFQPFQRQIGEERASRTVRCLENTGDVVRLLLLYAGAKLGVLRQCRAQIDRDGPRIIEGRLGRRPRMTALGTSPRLSVSSWRRALSLATRRSMTACIKACLDL